MDFLLDVYPLALATKIVLLVELLGLFVGLNRGLVLLSQLEGIALGDELEVDLVLYAAKEITVEMVLL